MINTGGINFAKQTGIYKEEQKKELFAKGLVISVFVFLFLGLISGWTYLSKQSQEKKMVALNADLVKERQRDYGELAEFMTDSVKLDFIGDFSLKQKFWSGLLGELEKGILVNSYLKSLKGTTSYNIKGFLSQAVSDPVIAGSATIPTVGATGAIQEVDSLVLTVVAPTLNDIAKQIVSLEESPAIADLTVISPSLSEEGVSFELKIELVPGAWERSFYAQKENSLNLEQ